MERGSNHPGRSSTDTAGIGPVLLRCYADESKNEREPIEEVKERSWNDDDDDDAVDADLGIGNKANEFEDSETSTSEEQSHADRTRSFSMES